MMIVCHSVCYGASVASMLKSVVFANIDGADGRVYGFAKEYNDRGCQYGLFCGYAVSVACDFGVHVVSCLLVAGKYGVHGHRYILDFIIIM